MNSDRLEKLLDAYFDQALTPVERQELEYELLASAPARDLFWKRARFHALLRRHGREAAGRRLVAGADAAEAAASRSLAATTPPGPFPRRTPAWLRLNQTDWLWGATAALVMLAVLSLLLPGTATGWLVALALSVGVAAAFARCQWAVGRAADTGNPVEGEPVTRPAIAELVNAVGVEWEQPHAPLPGTALSAGLLRFAKGLVELQFFRGARVVIQGPAEFELVSDMEARCRRGRLRAAVPLPAQGFRLLTPSLQLVDLGTEFALDVETDGRAEVHVFTGEVEMTDAAAATAPRKLLEGQATRVLVNGRTADIPVDRAGFVTLEEVHRKADGLMRERHAAWRAAMRELAADPALLVHFDFEQLPSVYHLLPNRAAGAPAETHGTIIGCQLAGGRWPDKTALDFKQFGDRVRFALPRSLENATLLAWLRIDGLDHRWNALLMSGSAQVGEPQWQFEQPGQLKFGKRSVPGWGLGHLEDYTTARLFHREQMGLWVQVALVHDLARGTVSHFLNGEAVAEQPLASRQPIQFGDMELGNWTPQIGQPMEPIRNFNGRLDEFAIWGRALTADEIQHLYQLGKVL